MLGVYTKNRGHNEHQKAQFKRQLEQLGFMLTDLSNCDILIVHKATDAPEQTGGIKQETVDDLLSRGGIYIEYSDSSPEWEIKGKNQFYGSSGELLERLSRLSEPISLDKVREALERKLVFLPALFILCQGYLAVHSDSEFYQQLEQPVKNLLGDVSQKKEKTEQVCWWRKPFNNEKITARIREEWNGDLSEYLSQLVNSIDDDDNRPIIDVNMVQESYKSLILSSHSRYFYLSHFHTK